jgi:hypothetical protein
MEFTKDQLDIINFQSEGIDCHCFRAFGALSLSLRTCMVSFGHGAHPVTLTPLPDGRGMWRVLIRETIWFDTDEESAVKIEAMCNEHFGS